MANLVILKGRMSKDPEMKTLNSGSIVTNFCVAVDKSYVKEGEERQANFFNVTAWGKTGEFVNKYFKKGQEIYLTGRLDNRTWETESGEKRYATDIIAERIEFCGSKKETGITDSYVSNAVNELKKEGVNIEVIDSDDLPF